MAGFIKRRGNALFRSQTPAAVYSKLLRNNCTLVEEVTKKCSSKSPVMNEDMSSVDTSKWKKVEASDAGIKNSMVPEYSLNVLRLLRRQGYDAYFVGGCVRDLILHRVPKDYDVVTTANLKEIRKVFYRAQIIGKRFPICHVWMGGSIIEVSSFDTVAQSDSKHVNVLGKSEKTFGFPQNTKSNKNSSLFKMYSGWDVKDCNRWKDSLRRDFTINSLFFDPLDRKIYDYANGMEDLQDLKLRTLGPAHVSFKEDCARILRGLRIGARLGLSLSEDIETAIPDFVSSVANLDQFRLILEMNYMLAYGAAAPSILLLMKFKLLDIFLPFQAAYLDQASKTSPPSSLMLVRLLSNMDKLVSCDQPAESRLWIAVLAFHIALVRNPQEATVVRAFASLLYHGNWSKAVQFARKHENSVPGYAPEVSKSSRKRSDEDLAEAVSKFTYLLQNALSVLTEMGALRKALNLYPDFKCSSGLVFIPKKKGKEVGQVLGRLSDVESYKSQKKGFSIDYLSLGRGDPCEISFVLGKIILDTITESEHKNDQEAKLCPDSTLSALAKNQDQSVVPKLKRRRSKESLSSSLPKTSKKSRSDEQETVGSLSSPAHESVVQKSNKGDTKPLVSETPKKKASKKRLKKIQKVKLDFVVPSSDMPVKEIQDAKSMNDILKVLQKSSQQATSKEDSNSLLSETTKTVGSLSTPAKTQYDSVVQKSNKRGTTKPPVSEQPKKKASKNRLKETQQVKETEDAKSMNDLFKVLEKSSQQATSKDESDSLSSETTKKPGKLSSLFK